MNLLPGVMIENVGNRNERVVFIRGFDSRQIPLFVDGIPVYVPYNGSIDLARFTTFDLSEIQVTKGSPRCYYGPNTLGGSINLVSRRPSSEFEGDVLGGVGFDDNWAQNVHRLAANFGSNQGSWYVQAAPRCWTGTTSASRMITRPARPRTAAARQFRYQGHQVSLKFGLTPNDTDEYAMSYYKQDGVKGTPPYGGQTPRSVRASGAGRSTTRKASTSSRAPAFGRRPLRPPARLLRRVRQPAELLRRQHLHDAGPALRLQQHLRRSHLGRRRRVRLRPRPGPPAEVAASLKRDFHSEQDDFGEPWEKFEDDTVSDRRRGHLDHQRRTKLIAGTSWNRQDSKRAEKLPTTARSCPCRPAAIRP
jgi:hypothetical protein